MLFGRKFEVTGMLPHPGFSCVLPFATIDQSLQKLQFIHFFSFHNFIIKFRAAAKIPNLAGGFHVDVRPN
jgi:hypothetical protein